MEETVSENGSGSDVRAVLNEIKSLRERLEFAQRHGLAFEGDRDIYDTLGYEKTLEGWRYWQKYERDPLAGRIVDLAPKATWRKAPRIESEDSNFESAWDDFTDKHDPWALAERFDRITRLGRFAILVFGFEGDQDLSREKQFDEDAENDLAYMQVYPEIAIDIDEKEEDQGNPRFGLPKAYDVGGVETKNTDQTLENSVLSNLGEVGEVHWTRTLHNAEDKLTSRVFGRPILKRHFNRLTDLQKILGPMAEAYYSEVKPIWDVNVDKDANISDQALDDVKGDLKQVAHGIQRLMAGQGREVKKITADITDPENPVDVQLTMIAAGTPYPKRILIGSEQAELASTQDRATFFDNISERQTDHAEPNIVRPMVDRLQKTGVLPEADYEVEWPNLFQLTEEEQAQIFKTKTSGLKNLAEAQASPGSFLSDRKAAEFVGIDVDGDTVANSLSVLVEDLQILKESVGEEQFTDEELRALESLTEKVA